MRRRGFWIGAAVLALGWLAGEAAAYITAPTPLKTFVASGNFIVVAKVDKLDPQRPAAVLMVTEDLKGKLPLRRLPINLTGDAEAKKDNHPPQLVKRLAIDLPVVLFVTKRGTCTRRWRTPTAPGSR